MRRLAAIGGCALLVGGCGGERRERSAMDAAADALFRDGFTRPIVDGRGREIGSVGGRPDPQGLLIAVRVEGLPPGAHGMHLHAAGRCAPPDFASAGGHWNARGRSHGHDNPRGPHDGDFGNLDIGDDGTGSAERLIPRYHGKFPATGLALVIHARPDDERSDPAGNSGARLACGIVLPAP